MGGRDLVPTAAVQTNSYGAISNGYYFNGTDAFADNPSRLTSIRDNFTMVIWARPTAGVINRAADNSDTGGALGSPLAIFPENVGDLGQGLAGVGLSVATNGVAVAEHAPGYLPLTTVVGTNIDNWVQVAVVMSNRVPDVYLNGQFAKRGFAGAFGSAFPSLRLNIPAYGRFQGFLDNYQVYDRALNATEIASLFTPGIAAPVFTQVPTNVPATPGANLTFTAAAVGTAPLAWSWRSNGVPVVGATTPQFSVADVRCDVGTGDYRVRVANLHGEATNTHRVTLPPPAQPPGFTGWYACTGLLPTEAAPAWTLGTSAGGIAAHFNDLSDGRLLQDTTAGEQLWYQRADNLLFPAAGVVEWRMRNVSATGSAARLSGSQVVYTDGKGRAWVVSVGQDKVAFANGDNSMAAAVTVDTTAAVHTYRVAFDGTGASDRVILYQDGAELARSTTYASSFAATRRLYFGDGVSTDGAKSEWFWLHHNGRIAIAPLAFRAGDADGNATLVRLVQLLAAAPGAKVEISRPDYVYATFTTRWMKFTDDVEFWLDRTGGVIQVRSASRLGRSDLGANRARVEALRERLAN